MQELTLKTWKGRGAKTQKGWICVFVCFATSAVHLEVVTDYSADAFIAAYRRFAARRGTAASLYSDCSTNFQGADAQLKRQFNDSTRENQDLAALLAKDGTQWHFNPPAAPHMGGKWEAEVKSLKFHLKRTIGDALLTFEESITLLAQIEAILNSRLLEPLSDDPDDVSALSPGHFLIGSPLNAVPEPTLLDVSVNRLSRWQFLQQRLHKRKMPQTQKCRQKKMSEKTEESLSQNGTKSKESTSSLITNKGENRSTDSRAQHCVVTNCYAKGVSYPARRTKKCLRKAWSAWSEKEIRTLINT
ncbi:uncharacterized protein LOC114882466 [Osmia bicornis bicornis]|uniref:uncharacterized protein LOC114882466 n=1 Tax=Osmia bicornis bicornis TaxID=1437191 RepID=UPI0010F47DE1|nr:uncharacterized protein LOC114882466 [Osmia bicornis bicornis]